MHRRFHLIRDEDLSGVSGTGVVAEGVEFEDGTVAICWTTKYHITSVINNIKTLERVHGHGGKTYVKWIDQEADDVRR